MCFADDLRIFAKGGVTSVDLLHEKFGIFTVASGLQANLSKSAIYYGGVSESTKHDIQ